MMEAKLILGVAIGFVIFLAGWLLHIIRDREQDDIMSQNVPRETNNIAIQAMINARWKLQAEIKECVFVADLEYYEMHIQFFENEFLDVVPYKLLQQHINELKLYYNKKYDLLKR